MKHQQTWAWLAGLSTLGVALALPGCAGDSTADAASGDANIQAAWVEMGDSNQAIARVVTSYTPPAGTTSITGTTSANAACPLLVVDGNATRMNLRVGPGTPALRSTASDPVDSKPSAFPVSVCEATLPGGAQKVAVANRALPVPKANPQRVLVLADTGCRMKKAGAAWQACL